MLAFWFAAAIAAAAAAALMLAFARREQAGAAGPAADPTVAAYERQLQEVDRLAARGLLAPEERAATRAETGRRLLQAARGATALRTPADSGRGAALLAAGAAPLLAMAVYLAVGRPDAPDQPYRERVAAWRADPQRLGPAEAAAVIETIVRERPNDPEAHTQLGRARLASGDGFGAVRALEDAARLDPGSPERWSGLAQGLLNLDPPDVDGARRALERGLAIDPRNVDGRYWLGRTEISAGRLDVGLARWRALAAELPAEDPRAEALAQEIAAAQQGPEPAITEMVEGLARRLRDEPNDPAGWARLARAYAVLGRDADLQAALTEARRRFADRPDVLQRIEAEAAAGGRVQRGG